MKNLIFGTLLLLLAGTTSCKKWMDVDARSVVKEEEIFEDAQGFRSALFGVYTKMSSTSLYGANLSFGFIDVLAQYYAIESSQHSFYQYSQYQYDQNKVQTATIWRTAYNAIANTNNLLENLQGKKDLFSNGEFQLIEGEAIAIRAFLHFDVLQLFAPSYTTGKTANAIPYVNKISKVPFPQLTVGEVLERIQADLEKAAGLLKNSDPVSPFFDRGSVALSELPVYLTLREERLNYNAVLALLAQVHLYKGENEKARQYALDVLDRKPSGVLFSLFTKKSWDNSDLYFNSEASGYMKLTIPSGRKDELYETAIYGSVDLRYKDWFKYYPGSSEEFMSKYMRSVPQTGNPPNIVILRAEQMSYIAAETAPSDEEGFAELNKIRNRYGLGKAHDLVAGVNILEDEILKEYQKMFLGEGKLFYFLKRKNVDPIPYAAVDDVAAAYTIPIPDAEKEFGNIK